MLFFSNELLMQWLETGESKPGALVTPVMGLKDEYVEGDEVKFWVRVDANSATSGDPATFTATCFHEGMPLGAPTVVNIPPEKQKIFRIDCTTNANDAEEDFISISWELSGTTDRSWTKGGDEPYYFRNSEKDTFDVIAQLG